MAMSERAEELQAAVRAEAEHEERKVGLRGFLISFGLYGADVSSHVIARPPAFIGVSLVLTHRG